MATVAFNSRRAILHSLAGTEMTPLLVMPASNSGYELRIISEILDGHIWGMHPNEMELSHRWRLRAFSFPIYFLISLLQFSTRSAVGCSDWLGYFARARFLLPSFS